MIRKYLHVRGIVLGILSNVLLILILYFVLLIFMFKSTCINCLAYHFKIQSFCIYCYFWKIMSNKYYCFCNMHRNPLIWSNQLFLTKPWLRTDDFFKGKKETVSIRFIHHLEDSFSDKILINLNIYLYYGKKTWCGLLIWFTYTRSFLDT